MPSRCSFMLTMHASQFYFFPIGNTTSSLQFLTNLLNKITSYNQTQLRTPSLGQTELIDSFSMENPAFSIHLHSTGLIILQNPLMCGILFLFQRNNLMTIIENNYYLPLCVSVLHCHTKHRTPHSLQISINDEQFFQE